MRYVSWFSGIGGFDVALTKFGHVPVAFSEVNDYAIRVYQRHLRGVPSLTVHEREVYEYARAAIEGGE